MNKCPLPHDQFVLRMCFAGMALLLVAKAVNLV